MGAIYDKVKKMTLDPGVLYLGQVADDQQSELDRLKATVAACCAATLTASKADTKPSPATLESPAPSASDPPAKG